MTDPAAVPDGSAIPYRHGTLHGYGRLVWSDLVAAIAGVPTAWADYDGFHIGTVPEQPPPYTHLWAWAPGWLVRARINGEHAIVAILETDTPVPPEPGSTGSDSPGVASAGLAIPGLALRGHAARPPQPVRYTRRVTHTWPGDEKRVGPLSPQLVGRLVQLYEVDSEFPVTFISLEEQ